MISMADASNPITDEEKELREDVKNYIDITYEDEDTDRKLLGIMRRGQAKLDAIAGSEYDYSQEGARRGLLFDYCRYAMCNQTEMFEENYQSELINLAISEEAKAYETNRI